MSADPSSYVGRMQADEEAARRRAARERPVDMIEDLKQRAAGRFYYLASPYTHHSSAMRDLRAAVAYEMAGELMAKGLYVYAAIPATHEAAKAHTLPTNYEWWVGFNEAFIKASAGIIVCCIPGWEESRGVKFEMEYARSLDLPIYMAHLITREVDVRPYITMDPSAPKFL